MSTPRKKEKEKEALSQQPAGEVWQRLLSGQFLQML
jgi:hypothetical protein